MTTWMRRVVVVLTGAAALLTAGAGVSAWQANRKAGELAALRRAGGDPDVDADAVWRQLQDFRARHAEDADTVQPLQETLKARRDEQLNARALRAFDELKTAEGRGADLTQMLELTNRFLNDFAGSRGESEVRQLRLAYLLRLDERDIEAARNLSARQPLAFAARRELYQHYLDKHPAGAFVSEAQSALQALEADWDRNDFRAVRDHFQARPGEVAELVTRCRTYLAVHPRGKFAASATELLRWTERVTAPGEYRVVLRNGAFERGLARTLSRGPDLSVELEVAGVRYGPSTIVRNRYDPEWEYEFPRRIRWKLGDPVRVRVSDHDYWSRVVVDIVSAEEEPLAMQLLSGELWCGANRITFASDFALPTLPQIE